MVCWDTLKKIFFIFFIFLIIILATGTSELVKMKLLVHRGMSESVMLTVMGEPDYDRVFEVGQPLMGSYVDLPLPKGTRYRILNYNNIDPISIF